MIDIGPNLKEAMEVIAACIAFIGFWICFTRN